MQHIKKAIVITAEEVHSGYNQSTGLRKDGTRWEGKPWSNHRLMMTLANKKVGIETNLIWHGYRHERIYSKNIDVFILDEALSKLEDK